MTLNITVPKVSRPFKVVMMRNNLKVAESTETCGNFDFQQEFSTGETVSCETWILDNSLLKSEKLSFKDQDGNEVFSFPYDQKTIMSIINNLKEKGYNGIILKAK